MMTADEIAWYNQRNAKPVDWVGLGVTGLSMPKREIAEGHIPSFWSPLIRNEVESMRFRGHDIQVWIGRGWLSRPFSVKGAPHSVAAFKRWFDGICGKEVR